MSKSAERRADVERLFADSQEPLSQGAVERVDEAARKIFNLDAGPVKAGDRLGSYTVTGVLGAGGQAFVYAAEHVQIGRKVALKIPHKEIAERLIKTAADAKASAAA